MSDLRHVSPADVTAFLNLVPDWDELSIGLEEVLLVNDHYSLGWHVPGAIAICTWGQEPICLLELDFFTEHAGVLKRIGVPCTPFRIVAKQCSYCLGFGPADDAGTTLCPTCGAEWFGLAADEFDGLCEKEPKNWQEAPNRFDPPQPTTVLAEFTDETVMAFQLVHVLVHELGHHHDRMTSPSQRRATRGEPYAEAYARRHETVIWREYCRAFKPNLRRS